MTFKVGEFGRVTAVSGENITYQTPWRQTKTAKAGDLEASGFMGFMASETPDIMEIVANTASFAGINRMTGKSFMSKENVRFLIEDLAYEFVLKGYVGSTVAGWVGVEPLSGPDMEAWFSSQDIKDAIVKSIPIAAVDSLYCAWSKGKFCAISGLMFALKSAAAITVANVVQRKLQTKGPSYSPQ